MKPFRVPIAIPDTQRVMLTQVFGPVSNPLEPEGPNGEPHFHYGIDLVTGDDHHTYGVPVVCPFPSATAFEKIDSGPMNEKGNGIVCSYTDPSGAQYKMTLWHLSKLSDPVEFADGQVMGNIGNNGHVFPAPSLADPYAGAHLHLGLRVNDVYVNPLDYFDLSNPYAGAAPAGDLQMPPAKWVIAKLAQFLRPFIPASEYEALIAKSTP